MAVSDPSLAEMAARLSCAAMSDLSKTNYLNNLDRHMYGLTEPPCELAFGFADRRQEHLLQKGATISRNVCIDKLPAYQRGPWEAAFATPNVCPQQAPLYARHYDQWTRSRLHSKCDQRSLNDCDARLQRERFI